MKRFACSLVGLLLLGGTTIAYGQEASDRHADLVRRSGDSSDEDSSAPLGTRAATRLRYYTDDDELTVVSPIISVTQKIHDASSLSAEYDADVLSAATVDVRTAASEKFSEVRHGVTLSGSHRIRALETDLDGAVSISKEADYASVTLSAGLASDFLQKNLTLGGGYSYVGNQVGRSGTPVDHFSDSLHIHALGLSATQVLSRNSLLQLSGSLIGAFGYQGSVYRYVPIFLEGTVDEGSLDEDSLENGTLRPLLRPAENVPRTRYRGAIVGRVKHYFPWRMIADLDYRFYADSWSVASHTLSAKLYQKLPAGLLLRLRNRFYYQDRADFYQRIYTVASPEALPEYFTIDRELGTFWYDMVGLKLALEIAASPLLETLVIDVKADVQYTSYSDFAYLDQRTAIIVGTGVLIGL